MFQVGGLDLSRVQSDALPHSLLPSMVICDSGEVALPRMMADARSIDTCSTDDLDVMSATDSPRRLSSPQRIAATNGGLSRTREFSPGVSSIGEEDDGALSGTSNSRRPLSAPNRSISAGAIGRNLQNSTTLPTASSGMSTGNRLREKRKSLDVERQRRIANIQEGARAAMHYSAKRRNSRPEALPRDSKSLPRDSRSASLTHSIVSTSSDNDLSGSGHLLNFRKSSSPAMTVPQHESSNSNASDTSSSTPLNLRHLSIDETREASLTQMDEIWRQVEAIGDKPSERGMYVSALVDPPVAQSTGVEDDRSAVVTPNLDPKDAGMELDQDKRRSEVLRESDISISVLEPIDHSTPLSKPPTLEGGATGGASLLAPLRPGDHGNRLKNRPPSFSNQG